MAYQTFLVGGAVRDSLLGRTVEERDWVVVGATPEQMLAAGFRRADPDFPVFLHPQTGDEHALARREVKTGEGYRGFALEYPPDVSLHEDLQRRDLTVNAMARSSLGELIDPCGGQQDLDEGRLRHVSAAFVEDPVRLLRIARFAAKLGERFRVAHATHRLLKQMVEGGAVSQLQGQRIGRELCKSLETEAPWRFFEVLAASGALQQLMPVLADCLGQQAHSGSAECLATRALRRSTKAAATAPERFAAMLLPLDRRVDRCLADFHLPKAFADLLQTSRALWPPWQALNGQETSAWIAMMGRMRCWQADSQCTRLLQVFSAQQGQGKRVELFRQALAAASAVTPAALQPGLQRSQIGQALTEARVQALAQVDFSVLSRVGE